MNNRIAIDIIQSCLCSTQTPNDNYSRLVLNLNNCHLVFALSIDMIGLCLLQYGYSFKENNGYSIYVNNTFSGLAPKGMVY